MNAPALDDAVLDAIAVVLADAAARLAHEPEAAPK
jgi:hypothetical protein